MVVEAAGIEPASEDVPDRTSTRVGALFEVLNSSVAADLRVQQADDVSISLCQRVRRSSLIVAVFRSYRRKLRAPSSRLFRRRREQQRRCYRSQLQVAHFYVAMGATTRDSIIDISVETGTPPSFQRRTHYDGNAVIWSSATKVARSDVTDTCESFSMDVSTKARGCPSIADQSKNLEAHEARPVETRGATIS